MTEELLYLWDLSGKTCRAKFRVLPLPLGSTGKVYTSGFDCITIHVLSCQFLPNPVHAS